MEQFSAPLLDGIKICSFFQSLASVCRSTFVQFSPTLVAECWCMFSSLCMPSFCRYLSISPKPPLSLSPSQFLFLRFFCSVLCHPQRMSVKLYLHIWQNYLFIFFPLSQSSSAREKWRIGKFVIVCRTKMKERRTQICAEAKQHDEKHKISLLHKIQYVYICHIQMDFLLPLISPYNVLHATCLCVKCPPGNPQNYLCTLYVQRWGSRNDLETLHTYRTCPLTHSRPCTEHTREAWTDSIQPHFSVIFLITKKAYSACLFWAFRVCACMRVCDSLHCTIPDCSGTQTNQQNKNTCNKSDAKRTMHIAHNVQRQTENVLKYENMYQCWPLCVGWLCDVQQLSVWVRMVAATAAAIQIWT